VASDVTATDQDEGYVDVPPAPRVRVFVPRSAVDRDPRPLECDPPLPEEGRPDSPLRQRAASGPTAGPWVVAGTRLSAHDQPVDALKVERELARARFSADEPH
jgi:hypothetical protein